MRNKMKKLLLFAVILFGATLCVCTDSLAQTTKIGPYTFSEVYEVEHTPVRDQHRSGTCWAFATLAFYEAEIIRLGSNSVDLSEMWIVRNAYFEKVVKYIRMHGKINLSEGGNAHDTFIMTEKYGLVPESVYPGNKYGTENEGPVHAELASVLLGFGNAVIQNKNKSLTTAWQTALNNILDSYFGKSPKTFEYDGKQYTPITFAESLKIKSEEYITLTSYTHHPFYSSFPLEIPDNWAWGISHNVTMDELSNSAKMALKKGYTVCWDSDVSEKGFKYTKGLALNPDINVKTMDNSERSRWEKMTIKEKQNINNFDEIVKEKKVTQECRQKTFDNYLTTDDHLMLITGLYKDQNDNDYFRVKNSWNTENSAGDGYFWTSMPFYNAKTISISIHKDALSKELKKKLNIK